MNARNQTLAELGPFIFYSPNNTHAHWLATALGQWGALLQEAGDSAVLLTRIAELKPRLVLLDFSGDGGSAMPSPSGIVLRSSTADAAGLAHGLARSLPKLPLVAVGSMSYPEGAVAALRAGVRDFIDVSASEEEAQQVISRVLTEIQAAPSMQAQTPAARGKLITLLGVRAGVGTSTLAAHLADMARKRSLAGASIRVDGPGTGTGRVALLDLGLPAGDGQLYLGAAGNFHFVDAVRNLRRFDETLVHTALAHSQDGVKVISLPRSMAEMRTVTHADALALLERLRLYFDILIADLGGFSNLEFVAGLANAADEAWLVTDQSVGALVSLASTLHDLDEQRVVSGHRRLVVGRYDERYGMAAAQIAERFNLPLLATLPERTLGLMTSANQGKLLHQVSKRDPYVRAVEGLVDKLFETSEEVVQPGRLARWLPRLIARR